MYVCTQILIFWKTPDEWADELWGWVEENGLNGTVCTVYELLQGDTGEKSCVYTYIYTCAYSHVVACLLGYIWKCMLLTD